jgi:hypothetical protein
VNDVLFAVNDIDISALSHAEAMRVVRDRNLLKKVFHFMSSQEYYRRKYVLFTCCLSYHLYCITTYLPSKLTCRKLTSKATMTSKNKFLSVIKQVRVRQAEGSRSRFAEYEVLCQMRSLGLGIEKEKICKWSVWRRYSEIKSLFYKMKSTLGRYHSFVIE